MFRLLFAFFAILAVSATITAQTPRVDLITDLLDLPAPAPVAPRQDVDVFRTLSMTRPPAEIPPDDAPIEVILSFWLSQSRRAAPLRYTPKPSTAVVGRILDAGKDNPQLIAAMLAILPDDKETVGAVRETYEKLKQARQYTGQIEEWLTANSDFAVDRLVEAAEAVADKDEYVTNQNALLALAKVDWNRAAPIVERLVGDAKQPVAATLAKWALYANARREGNEMDVTKYRRQLQDVVENTKMPDGARDLAFDALCKEGDWDGRDDWYISLLSDETLYDLRVQGRSFTGLTTLILYSPPEKYVAAMAKLVENNNPVIRKMAIRNLASSVRSDNPDAVRALLPWLANPGWATEVVSERSTLVTALSRLRIPESVPGLIAVASNEPQLRSSAVNALSNLRDSRAVPALRQLAGNEQNPFQRYAIIAAIDSCGGFTDEEKMAALESFAAAVPAGDPNASMESLAIPGAKGMKLAIGRLTAEKREPNESFVRVVLERLKVLRRTEPAVAATIDGLMRGWRGAAVYAEFLRRIRAGEASLPDILSILAKRAEIRTTNVVDVGSLAATGGLPRAVAACISESEPEAVAILRQPDNVAKSAVLGCARLMRIALPVSEVGELLRQKDALLALAAERYLEAEDSVEARTLLLAKYPGEARILGARRTFVPHGVSEKMSSVLEELTRTLDAVRPPSGSSLANIEKFEKSLRDEMLSNPKLTAIYGVVATGEFGNRIIRVFADRVVFTAYDDPARYRERVLSPREFEEFQRFVLDQKVDTYVAGAVTCWDCQSIEFLMFTKAGGRRVFTPATEGDPLVKQLAAIFLELDNDAMKLHYRVADRIPGLEVLLADDNLRAAAVVKTGADLNVLIEDVKRGEANREQFQAEMESRPKSDEDYLANARRRMELQFAHFEWRNFGGGQLGARVPQPPGINTPPDLTYNYGDLSPYGASVPLQPQTDKGLIQQQPDEEGESGIYRLTKTLPPSLLAKGYFDGLTITADGKWAVATKTAESDADENVFVSINLSTGRTKPIVIAGAGDLEADGPIPGGGKVLVHAEAPSRSPFSAVPDADTPKPTRTPATQTAKSGLFVLDPATGVATPILKGEFRPIVDQTTRLLQPTGVPNEFWAAIYDDKSNETTVGRFDAVKLEFRPLVKLPEIKLSSMDIWVDESESKIYFTYQGDLLAAPLRK